MGSPYQANARGKEVKMEHILLIFDWVIPQVVSGVEISAIPLAHG